MPSVKRRGTGRRRDASTTTRPAGLQRPGQRRRTRQAILDATVALLARGETPSVARVAENADVSRRTVYMYFPTLDQLLIDATLGALSQVPVDRAIEAGEFGEDVEARVEGMARVLHRVSPDMEHLGRTLIRLTVESSGDRGHGVSPLRGYRRIAWIEKALRPLREQLDARRFERLVSALAMVVGWEALIVQRDVRGLSPAEGEELSVWAARALLNATLQEVPGPPSGKRTVGSRPSPARARSPRR